MDIMTSVKLLQEERVNQANRVKALSHPLRLKIFFYLIAYGQLTLKQLSDKLSKGKTHEPVIILLIKCMQLQMKLFTFS